MHHPAAQSEDGRSRARAPTLPTRVRARLDCRGGTHGRGGSLRQPWHVSSFCVDATRGDDDAGVRIHRGQSAPAGRAHRDRGSDRRRPRQDSSCSLRRASTLAELGLRQDDIPPPRGFAIQVRVNMESMGADGTAKPSGGTLTAFELPSGPGVRVDTFGYAGYTTNPNFDSLLAKLIAHSPSAEFRRRRSPRPIARCASSGSRACATNLAFLQSLLRHPEFIAQSRLHALRRGQHRRAGRAAGNGANGHPKLFFDRPAAATPTPARLVDAWLESKSTTDDPLAVLRHGKSARRAGRPNRRARSRRPPVASDITGPEGTVAVAAPMQGTIVSHGCGRRRRGACRASSSSSWKR